MKTVKAKAKTQYFYPCPDCKKDILVYIPEKKHVTKDKPFWDGLTQCPNKKCNKMHFKRAYVGGKIEIQQLD